MKKSFFVLILFCIGLAPLAHAQKKEPVLMKVNGKAVTKSEFEAIFKKNNRDSVVTKKSLDEYVKLFTNFKLKVAEAEELGMDTLKKFKEELAGYRKQLAKPYLVDTKMNDDLLKEAYDRLQWEVRASHILVLCNPDASPEDTLKAWKKIIALREKAVKTNDFATVAGEGSEDPSAKTNKGDLGFFTSFQMIYSFETACYNLKKGEISQPVRTRYGYHLVNLTDKRKARGTILVAHILIAARDEDPVDKKENARLRAEEILGRIKKGEDFAMLASQFSDDQSSRAKGGELKWFGPREMTEEFENASFSLEKDGDVTELVKTTYGYHIIKRLQLKTSDSFDKMKGELKMRISRDSRSYLPQASFVKKLRKKYSVKENKKAFDGIVKTIDTTIFAGQWDTKKADGLKSKLFSFAKKNYTQADFVNYIGKNQRKDKKQDIDQYMRFMFDRFIGEELLAYEDSKLESQYTEFRLLMKEYRDGILLFDLTDKKVWSKAVKDTAGLRVFYEANKMNYMHGRRFDCEIYTCKDETIALSVLKDIQTGTVSEQDMDAKYNKESKLNMRVEKGLFSESDKPVIKRIDNSKPGVNNPVNENGQFMVVKINRIMEPSPKSLFEAKGPVTSDYQDSLEQEWLAQLKAKYKVEVNNEVLYSIK
ncbi:MAG: peptidylprolyl isomerase [Flavobacteriales bacterium]